MRRDLGSLGLCVLVGVLALGPLPQVPGLALVDLGFASLGHAAGELISVAVATPLPAALGGLLLPLAVPLGLAVRFARSPGERHAAAVCLAWSAAVLTALAQAATEAAEPGPAPVGGPHDWAVVLGPRGFRALAEAGDVAAALRGGAVVLLVAAVVLSVVPLALAGVRAVGAPPPAPAAWNGTNRRRI